MTIIPSGAALGAEIQNVELRRLSDRDFNEIHRSWLDHLVILFRGQQLAVDDLIAFSRRFGELDWAPVQETGRRFVEGHPEIYVVSNVIEKGVPIGSLGAGEAVWHTDMSYLENPPKASMLYALEIPPAGGDTHFCNMYLAYESLPDALRRRASSLTLKHDATYNSGGYVRQGLAATDDPVSSSGVYHPLVTTHPETGRRALYLGRRRNAYLGGLPRAESEALLDELWSYVERADIAWCNRWRTGDVALRDTRCPIHRGDSFEPHARRILYRTKTKSAPSQPPRTRAAP